METRTYALGREVRKDCMMSVDDNNRAYALYRSCLLVPPCIQYFTQG